MATFARCGSNDANKAQSLGFVDTAGYPTQWEGWAGWAEPSVFDL
jgi:hypothetical protein